MCRVAMLTASNFKTEAVIVEKPCLQLFHQSGGNTHESIFFRNNQRGNSTDIPLLMKCWNQVSANKSDNLGVNDRN